MKSQFNLPNKILEDYAIYKILSLFLSLTLLKHIGVLPLCGDTGVLCTVAVFHAWSVHRGMTEKVPGPTDELKLSKKLHGSRPEMIWAVGK